MVHRSIDGRGAAALPGPRLAATSRAGVALALAALVLGACAPAAASPSEGPPQRLADTGLYADLAAGVLHPDVLAYEPQYPLWTDGATKRRWIRLPAGTAIDASEPQAWRFPAGTRLWKEFSLGRRIETRMLELGADGTWSFATYLWSEDGSDAVLAPAAGARGIAESAPGVPYDVPAVADCRACHGEGARAVLGFGALQLSPDRDPLAPHAVAPAEDAVDLAELVERGLVRGLAPGLASRPPALAGRTPRERAVLGYLAANCGSCHGTDGPLASLGLVLAPSGAGGEEEVLAGLLGRPPRSRPVPGIDALVVPGEPSRSLLVHRLGSRQPLLQMPPLGTHAVDEQALALVEDWIREDLAPRQPRP